MSAYLPCTDGLRLNIDNKLGFIENHYMSEKTEQAKRKYAEPLELIDTDIETSGVFSSDSLSESPSKRQKLQ